MQTNKSKLLLKQEQIEHIVSVLTPRNNLDSIKAIFSKIHLEKAYTNISSSTWKIYKK